MSATVNNSITFAEENVIDPAASINIALKQIDAMLGVRVLSIGDNAPPGSPADGDRYIVGTAPTGAWSGEADKLAQWLDSQWHFYDAAMAVNLDDDTLYIHISTGWVPISS